MSNITEVTFSTERYAVTEPLYQYDYGQVLKITAPSLPDPYTVHFGNARSSGESLTVIGTASDGAAIPSALLATGLNVYAWVFLHTGENDGETEYMIEIPVIRRAEPTDDPVIEEDPSAVDIIMGEIADLKEDIEQLDGLSDDVKTALMAVVNHVGWDNTDGQQYIDALYDALYPPAPPATLVSISAVYTQSGTVYDTDTLDSLKTDLVVTATYDDSTTETVITYTLSGTLTEGTSTITVTYGGKTTTFTVTVTHAVQTYVTDGLIDRWDGIDNTRSGHNASATAWEDLVGSHDLTLNSTTKATWGTDHLYFTGETNQHIKDANSGLDGSALTVEVVLAPETNATGQVFAWYGNATYKRAILFYSNNTISEYFEGSNRSDYATGLTNFSDIETIAITYPANSKEGTMYINNTQVAKTGSASSWNNTSGYSTIQFGNQTGSSGNYQYKGKVYAIRFYNRELTTAELTQNHQVDVARFGLGA